MAKQKKPIKREQQPLRRQRSQKPVSTPRMMARQQILLQLHDMIVACEELFRAHGDGCECEACCVTSCMIGSLRVFRLMLEIS